MASVRLLAVELHHLDSVPDHHHSGDHHCRVTAHNQLVVRPNESSRVAYDRPPSGPSLRLHHSTMSNAESGERLPGPLLQHDQFCVAQPTDMESHLLRLCPHQFAREHDLPGGVDAHTLVEHGQSSVARAHVVHAMSGHGLCHDVRVQC